MRRARNRDLPKYITTYNFWKGVGTAEQGEISLQIACNNSCVFCYTANYTFEPTTRQVYYEIMKARESGLKWINFTGGEPTLRPDFFEILDYAKRLDFEVIYLKTHGRRFSDMNFARRIVGKVTFAHISVHGPNAEIHDRVTRTPGSFDEVMRGIENLVALGVPVVGMTVINRINYKTLADTVRVLHEMGVCSHSFAYPYPSGYALDLFEISFPLHEECKQYVWEAMDLLDQLDKHSQFDNIPLCHLTGHEKFANHMWFKALPNDGHEWGPECGKCIYRPICNGIPGYYIRQRGWDEFMPVTEQADAAWTQPHSLHLSRHATPYTTCRFLPQQSGGVLNGKFMAALTPPGYRLLSTVFEQMTTAQVEERLGAYALRFVGALYERGLLSLRETSPTREAPAKVEAIADGEPLEYPLYQKHPPYPYVTLIG